MSARRIFRKLYRRRYEKTACQDPASNSPSRSVLREANCTYFTRQVPERCSLAYRQRFRPTRRLALRSTRFLRHSASYRGEKC